MTPPSWRPGARPRATLLTTALAAVGLTLALATAPSAVRAHAIESSLDRLSALNDELVLQSRFGNGEPADDAVVRLMPPGGQPIEIGRTDPEGKLRFRLPQGAEPNWEVQVDRGPGHRDYLELPDQPAQGSHSSGPSLSRALNGALANPMAMAGYVLGLSGTAAGLLAMRRSR